MIINYVLLAAINAAALSPTVEFMDSRDDSRKTYVIITHENKTCKVLVNKTELKDYDKIIAVVMEKCGL